MSDDTAENVIRFIKATGEKHGVIEFAGGEALIEFEFIKKFIARVREVIPEDEMYLRFIIQTNLSRLDAEKMQFIKENIIHIGISMDGYEEINDVKRGYCNGMGTYKDIVKSLQLLQDNGLPGGIVSVATRDNRDKIIDIVEYFKSLGCTNVKLNPVFKIGRADSD